jgi:hypothetical protein
MPDRDQTEVFAVPEPSASGGPGGMALKQWLSGHERWLWRWLMVLLLLVYTASVVDWLSADSFWFDEVTSIYYAGGFSEGGPQSLSEAIESQLNEDMADETNPPGYYISLFFWIRAVGTSEFAVRAFSLLAGALTIAVVYRLDVNLHGQYAGFAAALLLGMCAFYIYYMHEARSYGLYVLFVVLSLALYHHLLTAQWPSGLLFGGFTLAVAGLMYSHYLGFIVIAAAGLYHVLLAPKNRRWLWLSLCVGGAAALFSPWVTYALRAFDHVETNTAREAIALGFVPLIGELATRFANQSPLLLLTLLALAIPASRYAWFMLAVTFLLTALANEWLGFISDMHYMLATFPLLALVAGQGVARLRRYGAVLLVLWGASGLWFARSPVMEPQSWHVHLPWSQLADEIDTTIQPDDSIVFHLPAPDPAWIHGRAVDYYLRSAEVDLIESFTEVQAAYHTQQFDEAVGDKTRFWLVWDERYPPSPQGQIERDRYLTRESFAFCGTEIQSGHLRGRLYLNTQPTPALNLLARDVQVGMARHAPYIFNTAHLEITLATANGDSVNADLYVELQILDGAGTVVAQYPTQFPKVPAGCMHFMVDLQSLPPGAYGAYVAVYDAETGIALPPQANPRTERTFLYGFERPS